MLHYNNCNPRIIRDSRPPDQPAGDTNRGWGAVPAGAGFKDLVALKGNKDIGDLVNKRIVGPLAAANKLSDVPDFNDAAKLGTGKEMVDRLTNLIAIFENKALGFSRNRADGDDILGDAYEYLMRHFATESGKSKGQFYTPAEVSRVVARVLGVRDARTTPSTTAYAPACGSGSLLLKVVDEPVTRLKLYGREKDAATSVLARWPRPHIRATTTLMNSKQRVIDYGEVYTPPNVVAAMLDLIPHECDRVESRFLEPACGDGNFLVEVLRRKLNTVTARHAKQPPRWEHDAVVAASSLYGIDLLPDNVARCRARLLEVLAEEHQVACRVPLSDKARQASAFILARNVVQGDALTFRTAAGVPVVLSEWSPLGGGQLKRRDFRYSHLLEHADITVPGGLFSDAGQAVYLPEPIAEFPPCHYLDVQKTGAAA